MTIIYVELHSGFGNQIFQYAFALFLKQSGFIVYILPSRRNRHSQKNYQILFNLIDHIIYDIVPRSATLINKKSNPYDWWDVLNLKQFQSVRICGYHQNYKFFGDHIIKKVSNELLQTFEKIYGSSWDKQTGFIHVRRTDYLFSHIKMYNLTMDYYKKAIKHIESINDFKMKWIVVSDDIAWCKLQSWPANVVIFEETSEEKCFWALTQCQAGAIIANSTFSYWGAMAGAYLKSSPVVYPNTWHLQYPTPDLFPSTWISL